MRTAALAALISLLPTALVAQLDRVQRPPAPAATGSPESSAAGDAACDAAVDAARAAADDRAVAGGAADPFAWRRMDVEALRSATLILCADCCYDDDATAKLVELVARLLPRLPRGAAALFALERRINFCLEGLRPRGAAAGRR